ncbi:MAG: hypothetical protein ACREAC_13845, partial [Blastocatellia bacterium]
LAVLATGADQVEIDPRFALTRVKTRLLESEREAAASVRSIWSRLFEQAVGPVVGKRWRMLWLSFAVLLLIAGLTNLGGSRTWAQRILGLLRVEHVAPVSVSNDRFDQRQYDALDGELSQLLSDDVLVTKDPGPARFAVTKAEASALAGFNVRLPGNQRMTPSLSVEGEHGYRMTLNRERLQSMVNDAGRPDINLPPAIDGAQVSVDIPKAVVATYGSCPQLGPSFNPLSSDWNDCLALVQLTSPVVLTPSDLNVPQLAVLGLQVGGLGTNEAEAFAKDIDWTSTLVVPVPEHIATYQKVQVDGGQGVLFSQTVEQGTPAAFTVLWYKDGIIYWLIGRGDSTTAVSIANSLR